MAKISPTFRFCKPKKVSGFHISDFVSSHLKNIRGGNKLHGDIQHVSGIAFPNRIPVYWAVIDGFWQTQTAHLTL